MNHGGMRCLSVRLIRLSMRLIVFADGNDTSDAMKSLGEDRMLWEEFPARRYSAPHFHGQ
jgi:hypothetical protein